MSVMARENRREALSAIVAVAAGTLLVGGSSTKALKETAAFAGGPVDAIYVYSFLDMRTRLLGYNFVAEVKRQLPAALSARGVRIAQLAFDDSPISMGYAMREEPAGRNRSSVKIPISEVVRANIERERAFGARYRMVVAPVLTELVGASHSRVEIRWDLYTTESNEPVWTTTSESRQTSFGDAHDERPVARAGELVAWIIREMVNAGVLVSGRS
jgi:hypothetical protein